MRFRPALERNFKFQIIRVFGLRLQDLHAEDVNMRHTRIACLALSRSRLLFRAKVGD